uniref:Calcium-activated potassium channel BK alpha subunit domain-containing protein n=1 Tax=Pygocentrus nattereri TaxID=42514 RepID=A0AAR2M3R3_PYGNA
MELMEYELHLSLSLSRPSGVQAYLQNVPNWDWSRGDAVICLAELKLGFMAQSCQVPGLSTLLANLFTMQSKVEVLKHQEHQLMGLNHTFIRPLIYSLCFQLFHLIEVICFCSSVLVNPPSNIKIKNRTLGFFIASDAAHAKRYHSFMHPFICSSIHPSIHLFSHHPSIHLSVCFSLPAMQLMVKDTATPEACDE